MIRAFPNTPTSGKKEAKAIMLRAHAYGARTRTLAALERFLGARHRGQLQAVLDALKTDGDVEEPTTGNFRLTDQGHTSARHHPNPPYVGIAATRQ